MFKWYIDGDQTPYDTFDDAMFVVESTGQDIRTTIRRRRVGGAVVMTSEGTLLDVLHPHASGLTIECIAHHLSMQTRYNGAASRFYSVAEHSVFCSKATTDLDLARACLLHDAHEAFIGDIITPLKPLLVDSPWWHAADALDLAIQERFDVCFDDPRIKTIDEHALAVEWQALMPDPDRYRHQMRSYMPCGTPECMSPEDAKAAFIRAAIALDLT